MRILFVCLGNICRSPTAEAVMRSLVTEAGLADEIEVESAGTGNWHAGEPPDPRATETAAERGVELVGSARQIDAADFENFDLLIAMDRANHAELLRMAPNADARDRVGLLREFDPEAPDADPAPGVPDPYFGGGDGFAEVIEIVDRCCASLLDSIRAGRT